jgi:hypothetical protein
MADLINNFDSKPDPRGPRGPRQLTNRAIGMQTPNSPKVPIRALIAKYLIHSAAVLFSALSWANAPWYSHALATVFLILVSWWALGSKPKKKS